MTPFLLLLLAGQEVVAHPQWDKLDKSPAGHVLELTVAVKMDPSKKQELDTIFWDRSNPMSPNYTQYLSLEQVRALSTPVDASVVAVERWLRSVTTAPIRYSPARDFATCLVTVAEAEMLLPGASYHAHSLKSAPVGEEEIVHRTDRFDLPQELSVHVDFVAPTTRFPSPLRLRRMRSADRPANKSQHLLGTTPSSIRDLYKIGDTTGTNRADNKQMAAGFLKKFIAPTDLQLFYGHYYPEGKKDSPPTIVGPNDASQPSTEGSLDIQYLMSLASKIQTTYWYTAGEVPYPGGENEPFVKWLAGLALLNDTALPNVISVSYADEEFVVDPAFAARIDTEFQKLAVRGTSLLFGSGDDGVTGDKGNCPNGTFVAWYPATSLYVTGVGATEEFNPLQGASFSGGGFSWRYEAPDFQKPHIKEYFVNVGGGPDPKLYSHTGRGWPDVAAIGMGFWTYVGGIPDEVGGTSAATPTFAAIISLLNDARLAAGKKPLGFLNQLLYAHPEVFTDIVSGTNTGMGGCNAGGFPATKGWDPVTGMGTPLFPEMLKLALSLP